MRTKVEHPEQLNKIFARHLPWEGHLYIPNRAPIDEPPDEILLIAEEVRELMLLLLTQSEQATHDEISYVGFMMTCLIEEAERVGYSR